MRKALFICLLNFFIGCSLNPVPAGILSSDKMEKVVYDLLQADEYINNFVARDSSVDIKKKRSIFYEQVFKLHGTNRKEFYTSFKYYQQHPDLQKVLFDSLYQNASRRGILPARILPIKPAKVK